MKPPKYDYVLPLIMAGVVCLLGAFVLGMLAWSNETPAHAADHATMPPHNAQHLPLYTNTALPPTETNIPPTRYPTVTHTAEPSRTPHPTRTPKPSRTPWPTATDTSTPTVTVTPSVTPTPTNALTAAAFVQMEHDAQMARCWDVLWLTLAWIFIVGGIGGGFLMFAYRQYDKARQWYQAKTARVETVPEREPIPINDWQAKRERRAPTFDEIRKAQMYMLSDPEWNQTRIADHVYGYHAGDAWYKAGDIIKLLTTPPPHSPTGE